MVNIALPLPTARRDLKKEEETRRKLRVNAKPSERKSMRPHKLPPNVVPKPLESTNDRVANYVKVLVVSRQAQNSASQGEWMVALTGESKPGDPKLYCWATGEVDECDEGDAALAAARALREKTSLVASREDLDFLGFEEREHLGQQAVVATF